MSLTEQPDDDSLHRALPYVFTAVSVTSGVGKRKLSCVSLTSSYPVEFKFCSSVTYVN